MNSVPADVAELLIAAIEDEPGLCADEFHNDKGLCCTLGCIGLRHDLAYDRSEETWAQADALGLVSVGAPCHFSSLASMISRKNDNLICGPSDRKQHMLEWLKGFL